MRSFESHACTTVSPLILYSRTVDISFPYRDAHSKAARRFAAPERARPILEPHSAKSSPNLCARSLGFLFCGPCVPCAEKVLARADQKLTDV